MITIEPYDPWVIKVADLYGDRLGCRQTRPHYGYHSCGCINMAIDLAEKIDKSVQETYEYNARLLAESKAGDMSYNVILNYFDLPEVNLIKPIIIVVRKNDDGSFNATFEKAAMAYSDVVASKAIAGLKASIVDSYKLLSNQSLPSNMLNVLKEHISGVSNKSGLN